MIDSRKIFAANKPFKLWQGKDALRCALEELRNLSNPFEALPEGDTKDFQQSYFCKTKQVTSVWYEQFQNH